MRGYYAGIGSRSTPEGVLRMMVKVGEAYSRAGWILRSGGASGADSAFEDGAGDEAEIYKASIKKRVSPVIWSKAVKIAGRFHPVWAQLPDYAKDLHARNVFQVLGKDLETPSLVVICWTPDGCLDHSDRSIETGGTGTAISIASCAGIPILNLARPDHLWRASLIIK